MTNARGAALAVPVRHAYESAMSEKCTNFDHEPLRIGPVTLRNRAFLAPMSGVTDVPFRRLAWEFGAGMVVSEMVASEALTTGQEEMRLKAESAGLPVHMVQLAGREAAWMAKAAQMAQDAGADIIDINMGCPSKRVTNGYSGSALMRDLDHATRLIEAVVDVARVPVTLKMRLGWDEHSINAPQLAQRAQDAGVALLTVHGRTRNQFYKGRADWQRVAEVRAATRLPLIVNGDITHEGDARAALSASGADAVMIGRASYGAPWLAGQIGAALSGHAAPAAPHGKALGRLVADHHEAMLSFYGAELGMRNARKHLDWYLGHLSPQAIDLELRIAMMRERDPARVKPMIEDLFTNCVPGSAREDALRAA